MKKETINKIKTTPILYHYLRENSDEYRYLYRNESYLKTIEEKSKEVYKERTIDKIERLQNNIDFINTFLSVIE